MRGLREGRLAVGLLAGVGCFLLIGSVDLSSTAEILRSANFHDIAVALVWNLLFYVTRGGRLWLLIRGVSQQIALVDATRISAIGILLSSVYPGLGEAARFTLLRRHSIALPQAVAVVVAERVIDTTALVALLIVGLLVSPIPVPALAGHVYQWLQTAIVILVSAVFILGLLWIVGTSQYFSALARSRVKSVAKHILVFLNTLRDSGIIVLRDPTLCLSVLVTTLVAQLLIAIVAWTAFGAFGVQAPFAAALTLVVLLSLGLGFLPSPLGVGLYQVVGLTVLGGFTSDHAVAIATATGLQAVNYVAALIAVLASVLPVLWSREVRQPAPTQT